MTRTEKFEKARVVGNQIGTAMIFAGAGLLIGTLVTENHIKKVLYAAMKNGNPIICRGALDCLTGGGWDNPLIKVTRFTINDIL